MDMYDEMMLAVLVIDDAGEESDEEEDEESEFGYDSGGIAYTEEDARSSYEDSEYHAMREE
jgi:hypothetical protein